ncbi:MAG: hypothetical protein IKY92_06885 [Akkermansia sp.]|nr:hypothetical protein [Akkermansia sp.]
MNLKSITFRCSANQNARMNNFLKQTENTRTTFITEALEAFLEFTEQEHIQKLNLFELVDTVDAMVPEPDFAEQA